VARAPLVGSPTLIERESPPKVVAAITARHEETLHTNREHYRRLAEHYLEAPFTAARTERRTMVEAARARPRDPVYLADLANEYCARLRKRQRVVIEELAAMYHKSPRTIQRDLDAAERLGILPAGVRPRRKQRG
jgi:hypothetical protein